jgi:hypothetical protein
MSEEVGTVGSDGSLPAVEELPTAAPTQIQALADSPSDAAPIRVTMPARPVAISVASPPSVQSPSADAKRVDIATRLRGTLGGIVPHAQYQLSRLGALGTLGVVTLLASVAVGLGVLVPGQSAIRALDADLARARHQPAAEITPEEGLGRLVSAFPTRGQIPVVMGVVLQQAQQAGVPLDIGHYSFIPPKSGSVGRYELEFPVRASYPQVRDFINRTLTAVPAAGLDKLRIERKTVSDQVVNADVRFVVFVRGE